MTDFRGEMLDRIRSNIASDGQHLYLIIGGACPRYAYTIGVSETVGYELIFAGAAYYSVSDSSEILNAISEKLRSEKSRQDQNIELGDLGTFSLGEVDSSWASRMMLGALDYYSVAELPAMQVLPDQLHWTAEIPDLALPRNADSEPAWRWLDQDWEFPIPEQSTVVTNLDALRGASITEAARWEEDYWEIFAGAGPDMPKNELREISLGTLLGLDQTLDAAVELDVGEGIWREPEELEWNPWVAEEEQ